MSDQSVDLESLKWAKALGEKSVEVIQVDGLDCLRVGGELVSLEKFRAHPDRIKQKVDLVGAPSFQGYYELFSNKGTTLLFAQNSKRTVTAKIDYHGFGLTETSPSWCDHEATLHCVRTPEWQALCSASKKEFSQVAFADFLEEWNHIFIEPDAARIAEVAMNLEGSTNGAFQAKINRSNGNATFHYQEETTTNQVQVPTRLFVSISPFYSSDLVNVQINLAFRIKDQRPVFTPTIVNSARVEQEAFEVIVKQVEKGCGAQVLLQP